MGVLRVSNEALQFAANQMKQQSQLVFGDRGWEAALIHHRDIVPASTLALGVVILQRLLARQQRFGDEYATRMRNVLTLGLAPLFCNGWSFVPLGNENLAATGTLYPAKDPETPLLLMLDVDLFLQEANIAWQTIFSRTLTRANLHPADRRFVLLVVLTACTAEEQFWARRGQQHDSAQSAATPVIVISPKRERGDEHGGLLNPVQPRWTLADIGGCYDAKRRIADLVWLIRKPASASAWGRTLPTGLLISGPPGTGKTMLVHALAMHTGRPLFIASMADIFTKWYGESPQHLHSLFEMAKKVGGILFLDEADGIVSSRSGTTTHEESIRVVNQFCKEMEQLPADGSVLVALATNFQGNLDEAAVRTKRVDLLIKVGRPDERERADILRVHVATAKKTAKRELFASDIDWKVVAKSAAGFSGADLSAVIDAALLRKAVLQARTDTAQPLVTAGDIAGAVDHQREERTKNANPIGFDAAMN